MENMVAMSAQILGLSDTIQEGMEHLLSKMNEGHFEDNYYLFQDIVRAFSAIYDALKSITGLSPLEESQIMELSERLIASLDSINDSYETHEQDKVQQAMQAVFIPTIRKWKDELKRCLHPLVDS